MRAMVRVFLAALLVALAASTAAAEGASTAPRERVAIIEVTIEGDAPGELRTQLERSLAGGLYLGGWEVLSRDEVLRALRDAPELIGCISTSCLERIGELVGAKRFVRARVEASGAAYAMEITLLGPDTEGSMLLTRDATCSVCTVGEANDAMSKLASQLVEEKPNDMKVAIVTRPSGAALVIDGAVAGESPWNGTLPPGDHRVRAHKPGRLAAEKQFHVATDAPTQIDLELPSAQRYRVWKWVAGGSGLAALGAGVWLLATHNDQACDAGPGVQCPELFDRLIPGIVVTGVGAAAVGVSVWMFLQDRSEATEPTRSATIMPIQGGALGVYTTTF